MKDLGFNSFTINNKRNFWRLIMKLIYVVSEKEDKIYVKKL